MRGTNYFNFHPQIMLFYDREKQCISLVILIKKL